MSISENNKIKVYYFFYRKKLACRKFPFSDKKELGNRLALCQYPKTKKLNEISTSLIQLDVIANSYPG